MRGGVPLAWGSGVVSPRPIGRARQATEPLRLFVVDPHTIYRRGLVSCLELLPEVESVGHAGDIREAWEDPALFDAALVLLDASAPGAGEFIASATGEIGAPVLVCASDCGETAVLRAMQAGAVGYLRKDTLTAESLAAAVRAAASGSGVVT